MISVEAENLAFADKVLQKWAASVDCVQLPELRYFAFSEVGVNNGIGSHKDVIQFIILWVLVHVVYAKALHVLLRNVHVVR